MSTFEHCPNKLVHSGPLQKGYIVPKIESRQQCSVSGISFLIICFFSTLPRILPFPTLPGVQLEPFSPSPHFLFARRQSGHCIVLLSLARIMWVTHPPCFPSLFSLFLGRPTFICHIRLNCQGAQAFHSLKVTHLNTWSQVL